MLLRISVMREGGTGMRVVVIGAGAVGGWFGGQLVRAGHEVTFVARGETHARLRDTGLTLNDDAPLPVTAVGTVAEAGPHDVALLCVKVTDSTRLDSLLDGLGDTPVALTQNSIEVPDLIAARLGPERTWPGVVRGFFHHTGPALVEFRGGPISYDVGTWDGAVDTRCTALAAALTGAGVAATVHPDARALVWEKAMFVTAFGALGALAQAPLGELRTRYRASLAAFMREIDACARSQGVELPGVVERTLDFADRMPADATSSMQRDLAAGLPSELDAQVGAVVRAGRRTGTGTPLHELAYTFLG